MEILPIKLPIRHPCFFSESQWNGGSKALDDDVSRDDFAHWIIASLASIRRREISKAPSITPSRTTARRITPQEHLWNELVKMNRLQIATS